jgi:FKBP-type peptidyl-prolyl cis-trans isomerase FkpA
MTAASGVSIHRYTGRMHLSARLRPLVVLALSGLLLVASACDNGSSSPTAPDQSAVVYSQTDLTVGTGAEAAPGTRATVQYAGWLYNAGAVDHKGQQFDANQLTFVVGAGTLIKGFEDAVAGMKVGGTRRAIIPPSLAYGATGNGNTIPPNAALVFEILLGVVQ